jgi:alkylhydroperoxidase family enzyme
VAHLPGTADEIRARVPAARDAYEFMRDNVLHAGIVDVALKRLCFRYLAHRDGVDVEAHEGRERAALEWARAIAWDSDLADDELWGRLHALFSEPELVELGCAIGFALGQQHWERTVGLEPQTGVS